jgi:hypothetical protein
MRPLKCLETLIELGHNSMLARSKVRKLLILKRRDAGAVDQARLESDLVERPRDVPKHLFCSRLNDLAPGRCLPVFPRK